MNTELKNAVLATDRDAQYDNSAKRLIAHKIILARILIKTVEKFKGMDPLEVAALIEGIPYISTVPVELGLTNAVHFQNGKRIVGFNTENQELNEGLVRFDICILCADEGWPFADHHQCGSAKGRTQRL